MAVSIAVVDDDLSVRRALPRLLASAGYETRAFASAEELIDSRFAEAAACLVLDIHLGRVSGFELLERLRAKGVEAPAVFITAYDETDARAQARSAGACAFLRKPFDGNALLDAIAAAIAGSEGGPNRPPAREGAGR